MKDGFIKDMTGFVLGIVICVTVFLPYMGIGDLKYCLIDSYHGIVILLAGLIVIAGATFIDFKVLYAIGGGLTLFMMFLVRVDASIANQLFKKKFGFFLMLIVGVVCVVNGVKEIIKMKK